MFSFPIIIGIRSNGEFNLANIEELIRSAFEEIAFSMKCTFLYRFCNLKETGIIVLKQEILPDNLRFSIIFRIKQLQDFVQPKGTSSSLFNISILLGYDGNGSNWRSFY